MWLSAYPSKCKGDLLYAFPLRVEVVLVERGVVYSQLYLPKILSGGSLCEILLCEGGDVELCDRTSKHILVFAIDPLSLTLFLILCLALIHIVISFIYAWLCLFVCLTCV